MGTSLPFSRPIPSASWSHHLCCWMKCGRHVQSSSLCRVYDSKANESSLFSQSSLIGDEPRVGSGVVRFDPLRFLAGCRTRRLNQAYLLHIYIFYIFLSYILACFIVLLFIRDPFYVLLVFVAVCSVFWLFWLSCHYLPSDWLERLLCGSLIVVRGSSQKAQAEECAWFSWFIVLLHCFICICVVSCPYVIYYPTVVARCGLFVLKVPLNPKQTNNHWRWDSSALCSGEWWWCCREILSTEATTVWRRLHCSCVWKHGQCNVHCLWQC